MNEGFYRGLAEWSQVAASVVFLVLLVVGWQRFVMPNVLKSQERKNGEIADAEARRDAAELDAGAAAGELASMDAIVRTIEERGRREAAALADKILADARSEGERTVRNAEGELDRGRLAATAEFRAALVARALEIARERAGGLDAQTDRRLVGETIDAARGEGN